MTTPFGADYSRDALSLPDQTFETFGRLPGQAVDITVAALPRDVRAPRVLAPDLAGSGGSLAGAPAVVLRTDPAGRLGALRARAGARLEGLRGGVRRRYEAVERRATGQLDTT